MTGTRFSLEVQPSIPARLHRLSELANDLMYSWEPKIIRLFERLDGALWKACGHNPKVFLRRVSQQRLDQAAQDRIFLEDYDRAISIYDNYQQAKTHPAVEAQLAPGEELVAYFCAEFGFHESLPIYSGGLGILAGDHCKAASDLAVPFVGVGLLYRQGYFTQTIDNHGNQLAHYTPTRFEDLPVSPAVDANGHEIRVQVRIQDREVHLRVWEVQAGHIRLYLLDSDLPDNSEHDRRITYQLYGGDKTTRIQQEIVLGIGGTRALRALGLKPTVWHINEGHAAFQILERCREYVADGLDFASALELTAGATVFTTHTPVPAGHDIFPHALLLEHLHWLAAELDISEEQLLALGAFPGEGFNQTALALRGSRFHNGVSAIHGRVASEMERYVWPEIPPEENPMQHVTNGVHVATFLAPDWVTLFNMRIGAEWRSELRNPDYWERIDDIPNHVYWSVHQSLKLELFDHLRHRLYRQHRRNGCSEAQIERLTKYIDPQDTDVLVVGFARRFATYKRATLLFSDRERLKRILNNPSSPVIFIFAGKAHPLDQPGQDLIRTIHHYSRDPEFEGKIILAEGYDIEMARHLVSGVDVWLNNPEYPMEASGTSGEKAGLNGVINLSVLDGWWGEGYNGENGWAIKPHGAEFDPAFRDHQEGQDLFNILENQVIPLFFNRHGNNRNPHDRRSYDRPKNGFSDDWVKMSKASMKSIIPRFNSERMVMDYVNQLYSRAARQGRHLAQDNRQPARQLAAWKEKVRHCWPRVHFYRLEEHPATSVPAGEHYPIRVAVHLDGLEPSDVIVECVIESGDDISGYHICDTQAFRPTGEKQGDDTVYQLDLKPSLPGLQHYRIRIYPYHSLLSHRFETGFMRWL